MPSTRYLGEFEQLVLLSLLHLGDEGYALPLRARLSEAAGRRITRGALYRTLDRLATRGLIAWDVEAQAPSRGGHPRRRFTVTPEGIATLRASREKLEELWKGLEGVLG